MNWKLLNSFLDSKSEFFRNSDITNMVNGIFKEPFIISCPTANLFNFEKYLKHLGYMKIRKK